MGRAGEDPDAQRVCLENPLLDCQPLIRRHGDGNGFGARPAPANRITPTRVAETGESVQAVRTKVTSMCTRYATTRLSWTRTCCSFTHAERISRRVCAARSSPTLIASSKLASDSAVISVTRATVSIAVSSPPTRLTLQAGEAKGRAPGQGHLLGTPQPRLAPISECRRLPVATRFRWNCGDVQHVLSTLDLNSASLRRLLGRERHAHLENSVLVRRRHLFLGHAFRKRNATRETAIAKLTAVAALRLLLRLLAAFRADVQRAILHRDLHVLVRIDARQLGPDDQLVALHRLLDPHRLGALKRRLHQAAKGWPARPVGEPAA